MTLTWTVVAAVLFAALLHAGWNALVKSGSDKVLDTALIHGLGSPIALPIVLAIGWPVAAAWPLHPEVDALGVRASGNPLQYVTALFALDGWPVAALGATASLASYGIALWAMTRAPVATVAALITGIAVIAAGVMALRMG